MRRLATVGVLAVLCASWSAAGDDLEPVELPDLGESRLVLPWSEFKGLLEQLLERPGEEEEDLEVPAFTLSQAEFNGTLSGSSARIEGSIVLHVLQEKGWAVIPVFTEPVPLASASLDGEPVALAAFDEGLSLVIPARPGVHTLTFTFFAEVDNTDGPSAISFPVPATPVASLRFTVPVRGLVFELEPEGHVESRPTANGTQAFAVLPPDEEITLSWGERIEQDEAARATREATVATLVTIGEDAVKCISTLSYRVRRGSVREFAFLLPADVTVTSVTGQGTQPFVAEDAGQQKMIRVGLNFDVRGTYELSVSYERGRKGEAGKELVPVLAAADAVRQLSRVGVSAPSHMEVRVEDAGVAGMRPIDVEELPPQVRDVSGQPLLFGYSSVRRDWRLPLLVTTHPAGQVLSASVSSARLDTLVTREGASVTRAHYRVTNSNLQFLRMGLPEGSRLWSTQVAGRPVKPARDEAGRAVLIPLEKSRGAPGRRPSFLVEVIYYAPADDFCCLLGSQTLQAPKLNLNVNSMLWKLHLPEGYIYRHFGGDFDVPEAGQARLVELSVPQPVAGPVDTTAATHGAIDGRKEDAKVGREARTKEAARMTKARVSTAGPPRADFNVIALDELRMQAAEQQGIARGILPIAIAVDFSGVGVPALRRIVRPEQAGELSLWYFSDALMKLVHRLAQALVVLAALMILTMAFNLGRFGEWRMDRLKWFVLIGAVVLLGLLHMLFGMWVPSPLKGFAAAAVIYLAYLLLARRREAVAGGGEA